jgi:hypothetical protein
VPFGLFWCHQNGKTPSVDEFMAEEHPRTIHHCHEFPSCLEPVDYFGLRKEPDDHPLTTEPLLFKRTLHL